jgi:lipopolysaccharide export system protein LptC
MTFFNRNSSAPWIISSMQGIMESDKDHLQLLGKTIIHRDADKKNRELTIRSSDLRVEITKNYAETDQPTEILIPPHKTVGTGMEITFYSPIHLKLLSKVKGRYELD